MTDIEKIKKGLTCCSKDDCAFNNLCPYVQEDAHNCLERLSSDALELINIQQMDIEAMRNAMQSMMEGQCVIVGSKQPKIVLCKDCRYSSEDSSYSVFGKPLFECKHVRQIGREGSEIHTGDWYCADGERR